MFLLDTDTLSLFHQGHPGVTRRISQADPSEVGTTIITQAEVLRSRFEFLLKARDGKQLQRAQDWLERSIELLDDINVIAVDGAAAAEFDRLRQRKNLRKTGHADLLIASIVLSRHDTLVTRNLRHFKAIPGLLLEDWAD